MKIVKKISFTIGSVLLILQTTACFSQTNIVNTFVENQNKFQKGNMNTLFHIDDDLLRRAKDDKQGTLYYAGLLLYFNNKESSAEIALRRAARTGKEPWAKESARLVIYFMTIDARYNQIASFLESIYTIDDIKIDPELFYYYAFALFLTKEYETLNKLVIGDMPMWNTTLRNRITIGQASFYFDFWRAFLQVKNNLSDVKSILTVITKYRSTDVVGDVTTLIEKIYQSETTPQIMIHILNAKASLQEKPQKAGLLFLDLDEDIFLNDGMLQDLIDVFKNNKTYTQEIKVIFKNIYPQASVLQKTYIDIARARQLYEQEQYSESYKLYKKALDDVSNDIPVVYNKAAHWRMLFSMMHIDYKNFISEFDILLQTIEDPAYFSNLLEEYVSFLLRKKRYSQIKKDFIHLKNIYTDPHIVLELARWHSILLRIDSVSNDLEKNFFKNFTRNTEYYSDISFDYLMNNDLINKQDFIDVWKLQNKESSQNTVKSNTHNDLFEIFVDGYFAFGLYEYVKTIVEENIKNISPQAIRKTIDYFNVYKKNVKNSWDLELSMFAILRRAAALSLSFPEKESDFYILYPRGFKNIVESMTDDVRKRAVIFALIREESGFDSKIKSHANAIGLMQLLKPTADDIAIRIKYNKNYSLISPKDNISLGYNYFLYLVRVIDNPISALAAYNGGLGNLWKWEEKFDTKNVVVFAESLPFRETRNYVRKVVSSAMVYALLYYDVSPKVMREYFTQ